MYYRKMASYIDNDVFLIHCFQDSLFGASLYWYMVLEHRKIRSWKDLSGAFLKQYKYNLDMAPTRLHLQNQAQRSNETFKEYSQRWRELAAKVQHPLLEWELMDMFISTLQGPYLDRMVRSASSRFSDLVVVGERIESCLKNGKIQCVTTASNSEFQKKKE